MSQSNGNKEDKLSINCMKVVTSVFFTAMSPYRNTWNSEIAQ